MLNYVVTWFMASHRLLNEFIHNAKSVHRAYSERNVIKEQQQRLSVISAPGNTSRFAKPVSQAVIGVPAAHI